MNVKDFKTQNATFLCGNFKIVVLSPIYLSLSRTLSTLLETLLERNDVKFALRRFVDYVAVDLMLPVQVLPLPVLKEFQEVFNKSK